MHVLFVHKNFPAQFGHVAHHLVKRRDFTCTFVSEKPAGDVGGIRCVQYTVKGAATERTHFSARSFENAAWHADAVYEAMKALPDVKPDLVVGHSGFGSTCFLPELYDCPVVNYFEHYYRTTGGDLDQRPEFPVGEEALLRARARNAMILVDLQTCARGYSPTDWQRGRFPAEYQPKLETIFDGMDRTFWRRRDVPRRVAGRAVPDDVRIVTYCSRGFESMRGFDIFMAVAKRICEARKDVIFVAVGSDRVCYGGDLDHISEPSFREHVLARDEYDLDRILFTGRIPPERLVEILSLSDLHVYLTVPFVLSWSMLNAMAVGAVVLGSDTAPVREVIEDGANGLLADFFDVDALTAKALAVLDDPAGHRHLGEAAARTIAERYDLELVVPRMVDLYESALSG